MEIISFYNSNINPELVDYQKKVFAHFGYKINQVFTSMPHGQAINGWLNNNEWSEVAIFDIDCIPLNNYVIQHAHDMIKTGNVYGAAQKANHIEGSEIYISPAFVCFNREIYEKTNRCTFSETQWHDVGSLFSSEAKRVGANLAMLMPVEVEVPKWQLTGGLMFGYGTNYQNMVYHAFESRFNHESTSRFIEKCKEVLK